MQTIGIFGGTFDPPHIGHLILAAEAHAQLGLDRLLWVLTPDPPHKQDRVITLLEHRLAMVRLALADAPEFELSTVEMDRPGPHYALDTVKIIADQNPGANLVYLMGGDSLRDLPLWHRPADFVKACHFIGVMRRPGDNIYLAGLEVNSLVSHPRYVLWKRLCLILPPTRSGRALQPAGHFAIFCRPGCMHTFWITISIVEYNPNQ